MGKLKRRAKHRVARYSVAQFATAEEAEQEYNATWARTSLFLRPETYTRMGAVGLVLNSPVLDDKAKRLYQYYFELACGTGRMHLDPKTKYCYLKYSLYPSADTCSEYLEISRSSALRARRDLEKYGLISRPTRYGQSKPLHELDSGVTSAVRLCPITYDMTLLLRVNERNFTGEAADARRVKARIIKNAQAKAQRDVAQAQVNRDAVIQANNRQAALALQVYNAEVRLGKIDGDLVDESLATDPQMQYHMHHSLDVRYTKYVVPGIPAASVLDLPKRVLKPRKRRKPRAVLCDPIREGEFVVVIEGYNVITNTGRVLDMKNNKYVPRKDPLTSARGLRITGDHAVDDPCSYVPQSWAQEQEQAYQQAASDRLLLASCGRPSISLGECVQVAREDAALAGAIRAPMSMPGVPACPDARAHSVYS